MGVMGHALAGAMHGAFMPFGATSSLISVVLTTGETAAVSLDVDGKVTGLGRMKNVGEKYLQRNSDQGRQKGGNLPGRGAGGRRADHGRVAGTAAAGKHAVLVAAPAVAGRPGRTATMAGGQAGTGPMTMRAARRLDTGRGQIAQGQKRTAPIMTAQIRR